MTEVHTGTVKWYGGKDSTTQKECNFGFIKPDECGPDMHVHSKAIRASGLQSLDQGQRVSYQTQMFGKQKSRLTAVSLKLFSHAPNDGDVTVGVVTRFNWESENPHGFIRCDLLGPVDVYINARQLTDMQPEEAVMISGGSRLCFTLVSSTVEGSVRFRAQNASLSNTLSVPALLRT